MASRSLGTLTIDLLAKVGGFEQGMDRAARTADSRFKQIERRAKIAGAVIGGAISSGAGIIANQLRKTINELDELSKAAQRSNIPTEDFSKLAYAAGLADASIQDLQSSVARLTRAQASAQKESSEQAKVFDALGIATKDAEGNLRSTYDVFLDFADAFQRHKGSPEILAAGMAIFGRSFQNLIPLLKDGSAGLKAAGDEAEKFGLVVSTEAGEQAEEFNDNLTRLQSALKGVWVEVASQVLPQLVDLSEKFVDTAKDGDGLKDTADAIAEALRGVADTASLFGKLLDALGNLRSLLQDIERYGAGFSSFWSEAIGSRVRSVLPDWLYKPIGSGSIAGVSAPAPTYTPPTEFDPTLGAPLNAEEIEAQRRKIAAALGDGGKSGAGGKSDAEREAERVRQAYESLMATMRERIALFDAEGEAAKVAYDLEHGALKALDDAKKQELLTEAQRYDAMVKRREVDEAAYELARQETRRISEGMEAGRQLIDDLEFELRLMSMTNAERATAIQLRGLEVEAVAEYGAAIADANRKIEEQIQNSRLLDGVRGEFSGFFEDVVSGTHTIADAFKRMADNITSIITQRVAENWVESLFGGRGSSGSGTAGGGFLNSLLGGLFGGGRANGGWTSPNTIYEVNERGIEMASVGGRDYLLTGSQPVRITPNERLSAGAVGGVAGGNLRVEIVNNGAPSRIDSATMSQQPDGTSLLRMVLSAVAEDISDGGVVARAGRARYGWREVV